MPQTLIFAGMENATPLTMPNEAGLSFDKFREEVLSDYRIACISREASLLGRKEVLTGKAKFGIFGDGKELAQVVLARYFRRGDYFVGYYRDQTFMLAKGVISAANLFSQLYADSNPSHEPSSAGRMMGNHFATAFV